MTAGRLKAFFQTMSPASRAVASTSSRDASVVTVGDQPVQTGDFDEDAYLQRYPDVALAVAREQFTSGLAHFVAFGSSEGRLGAKADRTEIAPLDPGSRLCDIASPGYAAMPPRVLNAELMPDSLQALYAGLWGFDRPESTITAFLLKDVVVAGDGLVFDRHGRLIAESTYQTSEAQILQAARNVERYLRDGGGKALRGTTLLCEKIGALNYGHWLLEMLPLAHLFEERIAGDWFVRAPVAPGSAAMTAVVRDSLELIGVDPSRLRWGLGGMPQRYEQLVFTTGLSQHGSFYSPHCVRALEAIAAPIPSSGERRIWVTRAGAQRSLDQEQALCHRLADRGGWTIADTGSMSLRRQIALFKEAEVVAGVAGAGLTNAAFSPRGAKLIAFVPARMPDIFFWSIAQLKGQRLTEVRCRQENNGTEAFNWECKLMIEPADALHALDVALES